jgi:ribosomal protein L11 methylase PrmA
VIAGGILADEADRVENAFAAEGLRERRRVHAGDWVALLVAR